MRRPSRTMPPSSGSQPLTWVGCFLVMGSAGLIISPILYCEPWLMLPIGLFAVVMICYQIVNDHHTNRLAAERPGESICTFARSFDYRRVDTWIIRAVFEELQPWCRTGRHMLPLRRTDELAVILGLDFEVMDDLILDIADRAGRSVEEYERKPLPMPINTVADLVFFLMNQPRTQAA